MSAGRHVLHVCTTCRPPEADPAAPRDGARLFALVEALYRDWPERADVTLHPVECMSGCDRACTVALSAPAKPGYLFGDKRPTAETARAALALAAQYAASETGNLPRSERPEPFRRGILAKIPAPPTPVR
jgi:predicted metal-binding protein